MFWIIGGYAAIIACAARVLLRPHRDPTSRVAWLAVIFALPGVGVVAYLLLGETSIGADRRKRTQAALKMLPRPDTLPDWRLAVPAARPSPEAAPLFQIGRSISGYDPVAGNNAELMPDSDTAISRMIADIDDASDHVHLLFYIWLPDGNGLKMVEAVKRAAARGVTVRAMADDLGSRDLIRSRHWGEMKASGAHLARALEIGNPILRSLRGRVDLRNHRKIAVIDNAITYCGSQNIADPAFLPKAKYGPWVDLLVRFEGPVVRQAQHLFATDWAATVSDDLDPVLTEPLGEIGPGFDAQVIGTGPTVRQSAMPEMFSSCMHAARTRLTVTTPYFVPDAMVQGALCTAARRGVETTLVVPHRNDDFAVEAAARSYYEELLVAGVRVFEYLPGLLHTKSLTADDEITLIGSANMDRRSFDLNYENNILVQSAALTTAVRTRQMEYINDSIEVELPDVKAWPARRRLWNNLMAVAGPVL